MSSELTWPCSSQLSKANSYPEHSRCPKCRGPSIQRLLRLWWFLSWGTPLWDWRIPRKILPSQCNLGTRCPWTCSVFQIWECTSRRQVLLPCKSSCPFKISGWGRLRPICLSGRWWDILDNLNSTEEVVFVDEGSVFFVVFGDHRRDCVPEGLSIDEPQKRRLQGFNRSRPGSWVQQWKFSKTLSWL